MKEYYMQKFAETGDLNYMKMAMEMEEKRPAKDISHLLAPAE